MVAGLKDSAESFADSSAQTDCTPTQKQNKQNLFNWWSMVDDPLTTTTTKATTADQQLLQMKKQQQVKIYSTEKLSNLSAC